MLVGVKIYRSAVFSEGLLKSVRRRFTFLPCAIASYRRLGGAHGGRRTARSTADGRETFAMTFVVVCDGFDCFGVGERRFLLDWATKSANSSKCAEGTVLTVAVIMQPSTAAREFLSYRYQVPALEATIFFNQGSFDLFTLICCKFRSRLLAP